MLTDMNLEESLKGYFDLLNQGKSMDAFEKYYADDIIMQEPGEEPRVGKEANRKFELEYIAGIEEMHGAEIKNVATNAETGVVFMQTWMDATFKGYGRMQMEEVQVQTWRDGQIVQERFFYNKG